MEKRNSNQPGGQREDENAQYEQEQALGVDDELYLVRAALRKYYAKNIGSGGVENGLGFDDDDDNDFNPQSVNQEALIDAILQEVKDERLASGWRLTKDLPEADIAKLCSQTSDPESFFIRKALEQKFGERLAEHVSDLLILKKPIQEGNVDEVKDQDKGIQSLSWTGFLALPSVADLKQVVRQEGSMTLREIKSATIEKLTNKIIRSFASDLAFMVPFLLIVLLEYRRAAIEPVTGECFGQTANWLVVYFSAMILFSFMKLLRIPMLRALPYQFYFYYTLGTTCVFYLIMATLFVKGNFAFWGAITDYECMGMKQDEKTGYSNTTMFVLMGVALSIGWLALLGVVQLCLFLLMLWALWNGVVRAATKMQEKFSVRRLIDQVLEAVGEGQLQDSLMIGFIQFLLTDQNYHCKICRQPFGDDEQSIVTRPDPNDGDVEENQALNASDAEVNQASGREIVQLTCNPTHVYHAHCISMWSYCPVCLMPIKNSSLHAHHQDLLEATQMLSQSIRDDANSSVMQ